MVAWIDARIPVAFGMLEDVRPGDALVTDLAPDGHAPACACCVGRTPTAAALGLLFQRRARNEVAFFSRVLVVTDAAGRLAVEHALERDPVVSGRFRRAFAPVDPK